MRILILHNEYAAPSGEEHALRAIAGFLEENGHRVNWFVRSSAAIKGPAQKIRAFFSGIHSPGAVKELGRYLKSRRFDVALVQNLYPLLSPSIFPALKAFEIPVVMRCPNYRLLCPNGLHLSHGEICERCLPGREYWCVLRNCEGDLFKSLGYALRNTTARITRRIVDNVDRFVVLTEFQRRRFENGGIPSKRVAVVPNIAPAVRGGSTEESGDLISFVGRISPEKGIEEFLAAAGRLPRIPFAVAGDASRMPELRKRAPANVHWMGFLKGEALDDLFRRSRILVFPSKWFEGFPNVITRAMMHGKPVIAGRLGGVPEIVEDGFRGMLFEPGNVDELIDRIERLYDNPAKCRELGNNGRTKAETEYRPGTVCRKWMAVFDEARGIRYPRPDVRCQRSE